MLSQTELLRRRVIRLLATTSLAVVAATAVPAHAQEGTPGDALDDDVPGAQSSTAEQALEEETDDAIVITGFRRSLAEALEVKRESVSSVDAIVAEDIAKFPDQNLAESLQRIPGVSIQRDGGEGRSVTVRGLSAQFTRVRVNGMETIATSSDGASASRERDFDFNVFASELFSSIVVHKTAEASLDEGSLGAVIDLNTGNPLSGKTGFTFVASAKGSYNDLSDDLGPRLAALLSWKSLDGRWGASVSAAYQESKVLELGNNTVRWAQARFDSVNGTPCWWSGADGTGSPRPNSGGTFNLSDAACSEVALAFHPRIPRYGEVAHDRERLGLTASLQFAPTDMTKVSIDGLYSLFKHDRREKWGEVLLRSNERAIDVTDYSIDADNNLISATLDDAWVRTEHYLRRLETEFYQIGATWDQDLTDRLRFTVLGGFSRSDADIPVETTLVFDDRNAQDFSYDYSDMFTPRITFGTSVEDPANFQLAEIRDRPSGVTNKFRTAQLRTEWDAADWATVKLGGVYRRFDFDSFGFRRDTLVCGNGGVDRVLGILNCSPSSDRSETAVYGFPVTPDLAELFELGDAGQPSGNSNAWLVPNLAAGTDYTNLYEREATVDSGLTRSVTEETKGGYLQFDVKSDLSDGFGFAANAGIRYVRTDQESSGLSSGTFVEVERDYEDWLPAANIALFPHEDIIIRFAAAKVMTRPGLSNLTPGGSVDGFNYRVSFGNPFLKPYRATNYDAAFEWYFAPQSLFSVAIFKKDVDSFPISDTRTGTFASTGLPLSILPAGSPAAIDPEGRLWEIRSLTNGEGANLKGLEIGIQAPFRFLPGWLSNFGGIANATFVDSEADYTVRGAAVTPGGAGVDRVESAPLVDLSKRAFNGTLYYEDDVFSARVSVSYRSGFIENTGGNDNAFQGYSPITNVDAALRYQLTENIELSLEGINLTDAYRERWVDIEARRNYENNHFGRTFIFGVRYKI